MMINHFMDSHSGHLAHGALKLSPPHALGDPGAALHANNNQFQGSNGYGVAAHHAAHHAAHSQISPYARDLLMRRAEMGFHEAGTPPHPAHNLFTSSAAAGLHAAGADPSPVSLFPGLHDTAQHMNTAAHNMFGYAAASRAAAAADQFTNMGGPRHGDFGPAAQHHHLNPMGHHHHPHHLNPHHPHHHAGRMNPMVNSHPGAIYPQVRGHPIKQEHTCLWIDPELPEPRKPCNKIFNTMHEIVTHITVEHVGGPEQANHACFWQGCVRDGRPFKAKYKLVNHVRVHTGEKPFPCPFPGCGKVFARSENLKIHKRTHTGEKPFKCEYDGCDRRFANSSDRKKHSHVHTSDKPYNCKVKGCDKSYTHPSSLRKHMKLCFQVHGKTSPIPEDGYDSDPESPSDESNPGSPPPSLTATSPTTPTSNGSAAGTPALAHRTSLGTSQPGLENRGMNGSASGGAGIVKRERGGGGGGAANGSSGGGSSSGGNGSSLSLGSLSPPVTSPLMSSALPVHPASHQATSLYHPHPLSSHLGSLSGSHLAHHAAHHHHASHGAPPHAAAPPAPVAPPVSLASPLGLPHHPGLSEWYVCQNAVSMQSAAASDHAPSIPALSHLASITGHHHHPQTVYT